MPGLDSLPINEPEFEVKKNGIPWEGLEMCLCVCLALMLEIIGLV